MFRDLRRKRQALSPAECGAILKEGTSGVLALLGEDGFPYAVPLSYVYDGAHILFHSARAGHKMDALRACPRASFCVIGQDRVVPEAYTTYFRSVIAFGTVRILEGEAEKREAIRAIAEKYAPENSPARREEEIEREWPALCLLEFSVEHLSGKEAIELVRAGEQRP